MADGTANWELPELRQDVATANHIVHRAGLVNAFGHVSSRVPGHPNAFMISTRSSPGLARPEKLLVLDTDGNRLSGEGTPNSEFWIHARIYAARPDVHAVAHVHAPACVALGQIGQTVRVLYNSGAHFADGVPVFQRVGLIRSRELGDEVASTLGSHRAMLLRGHGANITAPNVRWVAAFAFFLEEAAALQRDMLAAAGGDPNRLGYYDDEEAARLQEQLENAGPLDRAWEYFSALARGEV